MKVFNYPRWLKIFYPDSVWGFSHPERAVLYLTFDDGPDQDSTSWVLDMLDDYSAKGTFFCLGNQIKKFPDLTNEILSKGHTIGNHSMSHLKGRKTDRETYLKDILNADETIQSKLFRPPYGSLKLSQYKMIRKQGFKTIFWSYLTYDFDENMSVDKTFEKMKKSIKSGDIVVFHDSSRAMPQLKKLLPQVLDYYSQKGYQFEAIHIENC